MRSLVGLLLLSTLCVYHIEAVNNGVARTPPMGWLSWMRYTCNINCKEFPKTCINENLYMEQAAAMASGGFKDAGYEYVNIDDCWSSKARDANMKLVADPDRFPHGIKALADYVHGKGLKLGIYGDMGRLTCGGYPGSKFTMEEDANTFAEWGIDSFKMDGCYSTTDDFPTAYPIMEFYLNKTKRPMVFSCSWPAYKKNPDYKLIAAHCNIWRNYGDIADNWDSVVSIINYYGDNKGNFQAVSGPGNFNDPDMLIIGNNNLSPAQERVQMAMWSIFAAPLLMSNDLRTISEESKSVLINKGAIAINQDKLGIMGKRVYKSGDIQIWLRQVLPTGSYAIAVLNTAHMGYYTDVHFKLSDYGVKGSNFKLNEVFTGNQIGTYNATTQVTVRVDETSVFFGKFTLGS